MLIKDIAEINSEIKTNFIDHEFIEYLDTSNIIKNIIGEFHTLVVGKDKIPSRAKRIVAENDIIYSTVRPNNMHYGLLKDIPKNLIVSTGFTVIRVDANKANPKYVYEYLSQNKFTAHFHNVGEDSTSTYPAISPDDIGSFEISLPSRNIQDRISDFTSIIDNIIKINKRMNKNLDEIAKILFKSWFIDFDPVRTKIEGKSTGLSKEISDLFPDSFEDSVLGEIPQGWKVNKLSSLISFLGSGKRPKGGASITDNQIPSIGAENINFLGKYNYAKVKYIPFDFFKKLKDKDLDIRDYDILIYKDGANIGRSTIFGKGYPHNKCTINEHAFLIRSDNNIQMYLYFTISSNLYQELLISLNTGSAQPGINQKSLNGLDVLTPDNKILREFELIVRPLIDKIFLNCISNNTLVKLRDTLLPKLISGELKIPDAKKLIDEVNS